MTNTHKFALICAAFAGLLATGCGGGAKLSTVPISGSVSQNGAAVPNVSVVFNAVDPSGRNATAITDANGKFAAVTTMEPNDGIMPGKYKVTLNLVNTNPDAEISSEDAYSTDKPKDLPFSTRYLNTVETDLEVEIKEGGEVHDLSLVP
ncbi:MAG: carboxypeptidase regulatory-like domain-containing protein [Planctomycetales bacterium]|nr:carboxypeptidase regulatory-like domain-containing protein [Planctomycetales bacterium]